MVEGTNRTNMQLFPESENTFFGKVPDVQIEFIRSAQGNISHFIMYQDG